MVSFFQNLKKRFHQANAARELNRISQELGKQTTLSREELLENVFVKYQRFFWIKQVREEFTELTRIFEKQKPMNILEIGTATGASLYVFSKLAPPGSTIISVDLPEGLFGGGYDDCRMKFYQTFVRSDQQLHLLRMDSHKEETLKAVKSILNGRRVDFMFIDGDHTYEGVKQDFEMYNDLAGRDSLIAFHDIAVHDPLSLCKVHLFWQEVSTKFDYSKELIEDVDQKWAGIGLVSHRPIE